MGKSLAPAPEITEEIERLFCGPNALYGRYRQMSEEPGEIVIPDTLYRFTLLDPDSQRVSLQVYKGIATIGGALWTREVRALLRVSARQHPVLPLILGGAYVDESDLAFVITEAARYRLSDEGAMAYVASNREQALRQLALLAHGLSLLHEQGLTHRNLHPDSIEYIEDGEDPGTRDVRFGLRLSRFEMSAMVSNLVRRQLGGERLPADALRRLYLGSSDETLPYCPPERAQWLFEDDPSGSFESDRADVYALGVLAWCWLVKAYSSQDRSFEQDRVAWSGLERSLGSVRKFNEYMRARLQDPRLPRPLAALLRDMLAWEPRDRPSIFAVLRDLTQDYGRLVASISQVSEPGVFYVGFMPDESKKTLYKWGWVDQDPMGDEGREQLRGFLEDELRGAEVLYCPEGFSGYRRAQTEQELRSLRAAKYVLVGKQAYWFCDFYVEPGPAYSREDRRVEKLLLIKYVIHQRRGWRLSETPLRRGIPGELRFLPVWVKRALELDQVRAEGRTWKPLLQSIEFERSTPEWMTVMDDALSFLIAFRHCELDARVFPFEVLQRSGNVADLRLDTTRDRRLQFNDALRSLYFREVRTPMGRLLESLDGEGTVPLAIYGDAGGTPDFRAGPIAKAVFKRRLDDDTVQVQLLGENQSFPDNGWIRPDEDQGSYSQLVRQEDAVQELLRARSLLHQLHSPTAIKGIRARWSNVGSDLSGRSPDIVKDMLSSEPFYGLHGPPGTGKTTVASVAVSAHLRSDPSQRVLISSQSHYALDNLALRILDRCRKEKQDVVAVRVASNFAVAEEKLHPRMEALLPERQATDTVDRIKRACRKALDEHKLPDGRALDEPLKALVSDWMSQAPRVELEIRDRIRRGANLVFATTGACTERNVSTGGTSGLYDWVIVEEAARAWPTELAQPLVRGLRWTLIGDHFQLPAFDELSVQGFLEACQRSDVDELRLHGDRRTAYMDVFRLFGSLFDNRSDRREARPRSSRLTEPLDELDLQFRMHPDICRIVSQAFYCERIDPASGERKLYPEGWLKSAPGTALPHALTRPSFLRGRALLWLDTQDVEDTNDQRAWKNEGEARVIKHLLAQMSPVPVTGGRDARDDAFALLTPYSAQKEDLMLRAGLPDWAIPHLHTVDSFQGREADVVVVSLVRSVQRDEKRPETNIGYLVSPNRVNVLLSRARKLLIIVGRLSHFEQQAILNPERKDIQFWSTIITEIRRQGAVVSAAKVLSAERDS
ncbi:AAA domain-containing protein [Myxococcus sp. AM010]|uniref:AAA domain-containing protein n=1 Tax=Myxococcus sp. AM010 TaxID=2745138 RepID=UPI0015962C73|nr:AAA domain-containing protein [Myxococcus sp. AM010]NVJ14293.1 hypothetical protein [Myxococcus sp. AM010]